MKKLFIFCAFFGAVSAFAQSVDPGSQYPWLASVIGALMALKIGSFAVGYYLGMVFQVLGFVASVMTILSVAVQSILALPEVVARFSGATALADKIKALSDKVVPWLKYFSIFNVQKPQA